MSKFILITNFNNEKVIVSTSIIARAGKENETGCWVRLKDGNLVYIKERFEDLVEMLTDGELR
jgi:hypothetical protein